MTTATKNLTDVATTAQNQFFEALEGVQDAVLEGVKLWKGAVTAVVPDELVKNVPFAKLDWLPSPVESVNLGYDFVEKLFAHQRAFAEQVLNETVYNAPATTPLARVQPAKPAAAAK
jgi:hypothetical protein